MNKNSDVTVNDKRVKRAWRKIQFKNKVNKAKCWVIDNKEVIVLVAPAVIGGMAKFGRFACKHINLRKQENIKNLYCYDRSLGHYWRLRRELSNREWTEIDKRKHNGERLADILNEMKVLK